MVYRDARGATGHLRAESARQRLRREFAGLGDEVHRLLELCPEDPYDDVVAQILIPYWQRDRTVLVGDAYGAVSLLAGQGGPLGITGAALLGDLLGPLASPEGISSALTAFERRWRPVVEVAQAAGLRAASSFLSSNQAQLLLRRWIIRASHLPGIDRIVARQLVGRTAKQLGSVTTTSRVDSGEPQSPPRTVPSAFGFHDVFAGESSECGGHGVGEVEVPVD